VSSICRSTRKRKIDLPARKLVAVQALLGLALLAAACSSSGEANPATSVPNRTPGATASGTPASPASAEDALARYAQRVLSQGFVANCQKATRPKDVGKQCASKLGERGDLVAYALGPTFSFPPTRIMILKPEAGDWVLVSTSNLDPSKSAPGIPWPLVVGAKVVVTGTAPDCLKVREGPGTASRELDCIKDGTAVTIVAGPTDKDSIQWWQLQDHGWAAGDYLRYADSTSGGVTTRS
jgi:hypothetical protein